MKTRIEELQAKHAAELTAATAEAEIFAAIESATGLAPTSIHIYPLDGSDGSATFGDTFHANPFATHEEIETLARAFPPVVRLKHKDGCTSFPTAKWWDAQPGAKDKEDVQAIAPFLLELDFTCTPSHGHTPKVELSWCAKIAGRIIEIGCIIPPHEVCRWDFDTRSRTNEKAHIINTKITFLGSWAARAGDSCPVLHHQTGGDNCERMEQIRWGRGSDDSGHKFTFYSGCSDADLSHHLGRLRNLAEIY